MNFALIASFLLLAAGPEPSPTPPVVGPDGLIHLEPKPEMIDLVPTFPVLTMSRAVDFYTKKLGFSVNLESGNYVAVGRDLIQIGLVVDRNAPKGYKPNCYIRMAHIDEFYRSLKEKAVKFEAELKTQPTGMKEFSVKDPDGNTLIFGEYIGGT